MARNKGVRKKVSEFFFFKTEEKTSKFLNQHIKMMRFGLSS